MVIVAQNRRSAFTLVEILIVIAIIAILAALVTGGVMAGLRFMPQMTVRNDILQFNVGLQKFYGQYKEYPPSRIKLCSNFAAYDQSDPFDQNSIRFINKVWPNLTQDTWTAINWGGRAVAPTASTPEVDILEGDQVLVFFMGGIPYDGVPQGFSTNPTDPAAIGGDRKKWMTIDARRLTMSNGTVFPSFVDGYGKMPYVYFSSGARENGYDTTANRFGVSPYIKQKDTVKTIYWESTTFQIISAGADQQFGAGGVLWPPIPAPPGEDDLTNFTDRKLGVAP